MTLTPLEDAVMRLLLAGDDPTRVTLRRQLEVATVVSRELTGVGFFTNLAVPDSLRLQFDTLVLEGVGTSIGGLANAAGFILFIANGVIECLEGFSYGEGWPLEVESFTVYAEPRP
jgi:hypothetical protein